MQTDAEDKILRRYLLETLDERDFEAIDLRIIEDEDYSSRVSLAEEELIEDFLDGLLSTDELTAFQTHFLSSPERKQLLTEIASFRNLAKLEASRSANDGNAKEGPPETKHSWFFRPLILVPAFGILIVCGILCWQFAFAERLSPLEQEFAKVNKQNLSDISTYGPNQTVKIFGGILRDGGGPPKFRISELSDPVLFRIALTAGEKTEKGFSVRLVRNSRVIFSVHDLRAYQGATGNEVRALLPRSTIQPGQFQVRLENKTSGAETNFPLILE